MRVCVAAGRGEGAGIRADGKCAGVWVRAIAAVDGLLQRQASAPKRCPCAARALSKEQAQGQRQSRACARGETLNALYSVRLLSCSFDPCTPSCPRLFGAACCVMCRLHIPPRAMPQPLMEPLAPKFW